MQGDELRVEKRGVRGERERGAGGEGKGCRSWSGGGASSRLLPRLLVALLALVVVAAAIVAARRHGQVGLVLGPRGRHLEAPRQQHAELALAWWRPQ